MITVDRSGLEVIDPDECQRLLAAHHLGRVAVVVGGQPLVFPVNYKVDGHDVMFRSDPGTKLHGTAGRRVAFEIDAGSAMDHSGWSVLVTGRATTVADEIERAQLARLPLQPWGPGHKAVWVRIHPDVISGRRIVRASREELT